jgi:enamine deaminase RidA (YjgF/YER057c/UK114 family)
MEGSRQARFEAEAMALGHDFTGELLVGGNYVPVVRHAGVVHVSGQVPRVGNQVVVVGSVGAEVSLERAQRAAAICAMRALALVAKSAGSLDDIAQVLRVGVFVRSASGFTQQSEVANGASDLLVRVLGSAGQHTRTSVGVTQLPKGAAVEVEMSVALRTAA